MTDTQDWYQYEQPEDELEDDFWQQEAEDERQVEFVSDEYQEREISR